MKTSSGVLFLPKPKHIQFTVIEEEGNQKPFTFKKRTKAIVYNQSNDRVIVAALRDSQSNKKIPDHTAGCGRDARRSLVPVIQIPNVRLL